MDTNAFMRHAAPTREPDALMPPEIQAAMGLDPFLLDTLFADQKGKIEAAKKAEKARADQRERLAGAVSRIFATDDGKILREYLKGMLERETYLVLQGLTNDQVVQNGAFREGCNAVAKLLFTLEKEAQS